MLLARLLIGSGHLIAPLHKTYEGVLKYFLQPQDHARRHFTFGNGYLSVSSQPAGSDTYSDTLLPLNSYRMFYYTLYFFFVNLSSSFYCFFPFKE